MVGQLEVRKYARDAAKTTAGILLELLGDTGRAFQDCARRGQEGRSLAVGATVDPYTRVNFSFRGWVKRRSYWLSCGPGGGKSLHESRALFLRRHGA